MSQGYRKTALGALAIALAGIAWAGGDKSVDSSASSSAGENGIGATAAQIKNGKGLSRGETVANPGSDAKGQAFHRKQARTARHADVDKARHQALDSVQAAFALREASNLAGSSESVNEKLEQEKAMVNKKGK